MSKIVEILQGGKAVSENAFGKNPPPGGIPDQVWETLIPGNKYWHLSLRNYLKGKIHNLRDINNIYQFTKYFVHENMSRISNGKFPNLATNMSQNEWDTMWRKFIDALIAEEKGINVDEIDIKEKGRGEPKIPGTDVPITKGLPSTKPGYVSPTVMPSETTALPATQEAGFFGLPNEIIIPVAAGLLLYFLTSK